MLYMVVEHYRGGPVPVYRRFRDRGRLAPAGLTYVNSWVTDDLLHCYQVMECEDRRLLQDWIDQWQDLVDSHRSSSCLHLCHFQHSSSGVGISKQCQPAQVW